MARRPQYKPSANGKDKNGNTFWRVRDGLKDDGRPNWEPFDTDYKAALAHCEFLKLRDRLGPSITSDHLKSQSPTDVNWALSKLAEIGVNLKDCVESYLDHNFPERGAVTIDRAAQVYLNRHQPPQIKQITYQRYESLMDKLVHHLSGKTLHSITTEDLEDFFNVAGRAWGRNSKETNGRLITVFFQWWKNNGYLSRTLPHAAERLKKRGGSSSPRKERLASPKDAADMLNWYCAKAKKREQSKAGIKQAESLYGVVFQLVLVLFGGARRSEAACLCWDHVDFKQRKIYIPIGIAKGDRPRTIPLDGNLGKWMNFLKLKNADCPVEKDVEIRAENPPPLRRLEYYQRRYRESFEKRGAPVPEIVKTAPQERADGSQGTQSEKHNIMRHSFDTYFIWRYRDPVQLVERAGHSMKTSHSKYQEQIKDPDDAAAWFAIVPPEFVDDSEVANTQISSVEEAAEVERKIEFLGTLAMTNELRAQLSVHWKRLNTWLGLRADNVHDLAKYREWHDDDGSTHERNEDGTIIYKLIEE